MSDEILNQDFIHIRERLNLESIKLWLDPYIQEDGTPQMESFEELAARLGPKLNIDSKLTLSILLDLQSRAMAKLTERKKFLTTGIAELRVKISGNLPQIVTEKIPLTSKVEELQNLVAQRLNIDPSRIKLISKGCVLKKEELLSEQGVKSGALLMAVILPENPNKVKNDADCEKALQSACSDIDLLNESDRLMKTPYLQITDQSGKTLSLPEEEKKSLVRAMILHEKGRTALEQKDYARALVFLLEADNRFNSCTSALLESVDNYAILNLDIAWCYLNLQSVTLLPEGEKRLQNCETNFHKSYGPNLERLLAIKGSTGNESALFMRLHLLQGILAYHQGRTDLCKELFDRVDNELKGLKIDDHSLGTMLELGYTENEAKSGLRAAYNDVFAAVQLISKRRSDRKEAKRKNCEESKNRVLGYCADRKQYVRSDYVHTLVQMGFDYEPSVEALRMSNNVMTRAVQIIQDKPELLKEVLQSKGGKEERANQMIDQISALGFDVRMVAFALRKNNFNSEKTIEELIACHGIVDGADLDSVDLALLPDSFQKLKTYLPHFQNLLLGKSSSSTSTSTDSSSTSNLLANGFSSTGDASTSTADLTNLLPGVLNKEEDEALDRLTSDIVPRDHYDIDIETEQAFLNKYRALLEQANK